MQTHEDIKRARRPERPAQVTAKKETVLSPEPVHNFKDHREIIARKRRKANRRREVFLARLAAGAALVLVVTVIASLVSCSKKKEPVNAPAAETTETPQETTRILHRAKPREISSMSAGSRAAVLNMPGNASRI